MKKIFIGAVLCLVAQFSFSQKYTSPKAGTPLRKEILDGLRPQIEADLHQSVKFVIKDIRVLDGFAFIYGVPQQKDGKAIDYSKTDYAEAIKDGIFDDVFFALMRMDVEDKWRVATFVIGATDVPWICWWREYKAPKELFDATDTCD